ncbi:hypothetical protein ACNPNP_00245 [Microbacterium sp. AGC85]
MLTVETVEEEAELHALFKKSWGILASAHRCREIGGELNADRGVEHELDDLRRHRAQDVIAHVVTEEGSSIDGARGGLSFADRDQLDSDGPTVRLLQDGLSVEVVRACPGNLLDLGTRES